MAIWCFNKTITCGTTLATAVLVYCFIILHNRREKKETDKDNNNKSIEIKITNTSSPNIHNERQIFGKNSDNQNNMPMISKVRQVVSPLSRQSTSNNPVKPPRKKLYQIQSKAVEYYNSIMQNSARFFTHDDESSEIIILNNCDLSFEHGLSNQDNLNRSLVIHINNLVDSINNKLQIKVLNGSIKLSTLYVSDNPSTNNSSVIISQKNESKEVDITIPLFNRQRIVESVMTLHGDRLTSAHNNKCTKKIERNNVTIIINSSM